MTNRAVEWVSPEWQPVVLGSLVVLSAGVFLAALWPKLRVLLSAAPENRFGQPGRRILNTLRIAFAQTKMFKESGAGWMHALIFWGFLVLLLRAAQFFLIGFVPEADFRFPALDPVDRLYSLVKDGSVLLVTLAVLYGLYRRLVLRPARLTFSGEGILILVLILIIMVSDVLFEAAYFSLHPAAASPWVPLGWGVSRAVTDHLNPTVLTHLHNLGYWSHVVSILFFLTLLPRSKHFHIITSIPNVFFSNVTGRGNQIGRIDFEAEGQEEFGVTRIGELSWKGMLDLHTCTECGRCDVVCPALNSKKPLSPKQFTLDLRDHLNRETPYLIDPDRNRPETRNPPPLLGGVIQDETLWSCTTCGACEEECPVMIEYVNKIIDLRRGLVMMEDRYPHEFANAFKSLETNSNPWGFGKNTRADWARDLGIPMWDKANPTEYLYFVGCNGAFDNRGKQVSVAVAQALQAAGVEFSILGIEEGCTGDPARRAGNEYLFDQLASRNAETFREKGIQKVITHCPHCFNSLKNEYPDFGARLEVIHHSELLERLVREGKIVPGTRTAEKVVFHDSCYMGRHNQVYEAPRKIIAAKVEKDSIVEVENSRERGTCCGAGGARFLLEEKTGTRMSHNRVDELMKTRPDTIAVSCPYCVLMLEDALKAKNLQEKVKVKDVSELIRS